MNNSTIVVPAALNILAITVGALTGALHANRKKFGVLGVLAIAFCTGLGGGAIRDTILATGTPSFLLNPQYMASAVFGAVVGYFFARAAGRLEPAYLLLDSLMIGFWVLLGCSHAEMLDLGVVPVIFVGVVSATGGGLLRDVMCHDVPAVVRSGIWYSPAAFFAAVAWVSLEATGLSIWLAQGAALAVATITRLLSVRFGFRTPKPYDVSNQVLRVLHLNPR